MATPVRLQLSRKAGFNLQALSLATNGLPAVKVTRRGKWGNPFRVEKGGAAEAVSSFRHYLHSSTSLLASIDELRGKNLACWCKPGEPCHADVLLDLANRPVCEEVTL